MSTDALITGDFSPLRRVPSLFPIDRRTVSAWVFPLASPRDGDRTLRSHPDPTSLRRFSFFHVTPVLEEIVIFFFQLLSVWKMKIVPYVGKKQNVTHKRTVCVYDQVYQSIEQSQFIRLCLKIFVFSTESRSRTSMWFAIAAIFLSHSSPERFFFTSDALFESPARHYARQKKSEKYPSIDLQNSPERPWRRVLQSCRIRWAYIVYDNIIVYTINRRFRFSLPFTDKYDVLGYWTKKRKKGNTSRSSLWSTQPRRTWPPSLAVAGMPPCGPVAR